MDISNNHSEQSRYCQLPQCVWFVLRVNNNVPRTVSICKVVTHVFTLELGFFHFVKTHHLNDEPFETLALLSEAGMCKVGLAVSVLSGFDEGLGAV